MSTTVKTAVIELIQKLPDETTLVDIMAELYFRYKVDEGLRQLDAGMGIEHAKVKEMLKPWLT